MGEVFVSSPGRTSPTVSGPSSGQLCPCIPDGRGRSWSGAGDWVSGGPRGAGRAEEVTQAAGVPWAPRCPRAVTCPARSRAFSCLISGPAGSAPRAAAPPFPSLLFAGLSGSGRAVSGLICPGAGVTARGAPGSRSRSSRRRGFPVLAAGARPRPPPSQRARRSRPARTLCPPSSRWPPSLKPPGSLAGAGPRRHVGPGEAGGERPFVPLCSRPLWLSLNLRPPPGRPGGATRPLGGWWAS